MGQWWWIPAVLAGLVVLDRLLVWAEARGWLYYRRRGRAGAAGVFGELMDVFQPSRQITVQETERRRQQVQQAESGAGERPGVRVDLDANRVTLDDPEPRS
nr:hypothetical protein [Propionibacterium sp.]